MHHWCALAIFGGILGSICDLLYRADNSRYHCCNDVQKALKSPGESPSSSFFAVYRQALGQVAITAERYASSMATSAAAGRASSRPKPEHDNMPINATPAQ